MRILNRPMFKYGGPIKEGIMQGMRNGGRAALVGNPVYPQTGGREHHQAVKSAIQYGSRMLPSIERWWRKIKPTGKFRQPPIPKGYPTKDVTKQYGSRFLPGKGFEGPAPYTKMEMLRNPRLLWEGVKENPWWTAGGALYGGKPLYETGKATIPAVVKQGLDLAVPDWIWDQDKWEKERAEKKAREEAALSADKTATSSRWKDRGTAPIITDSMRAELAKKQQGERLQSYLDMMGYDSAKKGAMSKALIDASALVQDATTEAGALKHADWGQLINRAIQTTSKRMEKPEQIREAVGLMMTKGEIEKDIAAGKGGALRQNAKDLVAAGVYKTEKEAMAHLGKVGSFEETLAALSAKKEGKVTGDMIKVAWITDPANENNTPPRDHFKSTDPLYKDYKEKKEDAGDTFNIELEFVKEKIDDLNPGDAFVVDDTLVIVNSDGTLDYKWK